LDEKKNIIHKVAVNDDVTYHRKSIFAYLDIDQGKRESVSKRYLDFELANKQITDNFGYEPADGCI
jgi:hypothetical protein